MRAPALIASGSAVITTVPQVLGGGFFDYGAYAPLLFVVENDDAANAVTIFFSPSGFGVYPDGNKTDQEIAAPKGEGSYLVDTSLWQFWIMTASTKVGTAAVRWKLTGTLFTRVERG